MKLPVTPGRDRAGFTLVELMITTGVSLVVGLMALTFSSSTLTLFAKNFSLNESHNRARDVVERANWLMHQCVQAPGLVNSAGEDVATGPAAGVRVLRYASSGLYRTNSSVAQSATSLVLKAVPAGMPPPRPGDMIVINFQDTSTTTNTSGCVQAPISAVSGTTTLTLTFPAALSTYFTPYLATWTIPANAPVNLLTNGSLISVNRNGVPELRYYPYYMPVSVVGQSAFDNIANYHVLAQLQPLAGATTALPFDYSDASQRRVNMDVRAISTKYSARVKEASFFESIHCSTAYRSAVQKNLQP